MLSRVGDWVRTEVLWGGWGVFAPRGRWSGDGFGVTAGAVLTRWVKCLSPWAARFRWRQRSRTASGAHSREAAQQDPESLAPGPTLSRLGPWIRTQPLCKSVMSPLLSFFRRRSWRNGKSIPGAPANPSQPRTKLPGPVLITSPRAAQDRTEAPRHDSESHLPVLRRGRKESRAHPNHPTTPSDIQ